MCLKKGIFPQNYKDLGFLCDVFMRERKRESKGLPHKSKKVNKQTKSNFV